MSEVRPGRELVIRRGDVTSIVNPLAGTVVPLASATDEIAEAMDALQELERQANEARKLAGAELLKRMDRRGRWTAQVGGFEITAPSPSAGTESYPDPKGLREDLLALARDDIIDRDLVDDAVEMTRPAPVYKARKAGIAALRKLRRAAVSLVLDKHLQTSDPPTRNVKVKPRTGER